MQGDRQNVTSGGIGHNDHDGNVFLTVDITLPQQNKTRELLFAIVILRANSNRMIHVFPFAPEILRRLAEFQPGHVYVLQQPN